MSVLKLSIKFVQGADDNKQDIPYTVQVGKLSIKDLIKEYSGKRDKFKKLYYFLNVSNVILQSSGILSIGSSFYSDDISAKVVAFASNGLSLTLMGLEKLLKTESRFRSYSKRVKAFEKLHLLLSEKKIKGESLDDIKQKLSDLDDDDSYGK